MAAGLRAFMLVDVPILGPERGRTWSEHGLLGRSSMPPMRAMRRYAAGAGVVARVPGEGLCPSAAP